MGNEMAMTSGVIQSTKDFEKNPTGQYQYWQIELESSFKRLRDWHKEADQIQRRYIDDRKAANTDIRPSSQTQAAKFRLNLFHSNASTLQNMLYGKLPRIDVSRVDHTGNDDVARVAAEMMERILRLDLIDNGASYDSLLKATLGDRIIAGLGCARVRYEIETKQTGPTGDLDAYPEGEQPAPSEEIVRESAPTDYYYWADVTFGWARTFSALPWIGFRSYLDKDQASKRFGKDVAERLTYKARDVASTKDGVNDPDQSSAWQQAEIWEIWDKRSKNVIWVSLGYDKVLETQKDPLQLRNFFPCPEFFLANPTNALYIPTPDYHLAQDLYNEIDILQTRIAIITEAVKVVGVYDASAEGVKRMLQEGIENELIPVDSWALFAEKGGLQGQIDWMPLQDIVAALDKLRGLRDETIGLLQQVTGMADIMRGELSNQYEGVGQTRVKAKFASTRVQALSEEFARFATDLQRLKAEVIVKHFSPETIVKMSSMQFSPDVNVVPEAVALLKTNPNVVYRVEIKSETMAQEDYAQLQAERSSYLNGLSTFLQAATPLMEKEPGVVPFLLEMLKWGMAGFKGSSDIEGVLDQAIETMSAPEQQQQKKPDPNQQAAQLQLQLEQMRQQGKKESDQLKAQSDMMLRKQDMEMDIATRQAETDMEIRKNQAETMNEMRVIAAKLEADVQTELLTSQINAEQADRAVQGEIQKAIAVAKIKVMETQAGKLIDQQTKMMEKSADMQIERERRRATDDDDDDERDD